jgi:murein L,D-transpeptidase YcbB/YkuD
MRWRVLCAVGLAVAGVRVGAGGGSRGGQLSWWTDGYLSPDADSLLAAIGDVGADGLDPSAYVDSALLARIDSARGGAMAAPDARVALDSALTSLFVRVARDLADGPLDPTIVDTMWTTVPHHLDPTAALAGALRAHEVRAALAAFAPPQPGYRALRIELARLDDAIAAGGWPVVMPGPELQRGARGSRVYALRRRLLDEGDLPPTDSLPAAVFDSSLAEAVRRFQMRHGLPADGRVGEETEALLAVPVTELARRIRVNMMRWRWLPRSPSPRLVLVNTPDATLTLTDSATPPITVRVVAGALDWPTPILAAHITDVVLHPTWQVPPAIVRAEMLPAERGDVHALARLGVGVWRNGNGSLVAVDPDSVDWRALGDSAATLFRFRQPPGPDNPLGQI